MARNPLGILGILLTFAGIALYLGCQPGPKADKSKSATRATGVGSDKSQVKSAEKGDAGSTGQEKKAISNRSKPQAPPQPLTIPKVGLTDSLRATCLVNVGDTMPGGEVYAADDSNVSIQSQYGEKLTVLFFWWEGGSNYARLSATATLKDLETDIAEPYAEKGVKVIGINVGDKPQSILQDLEKIGVKLPYYFDPDKDFFGKVATSILPRIYLLDSSGKILWFDTECSQGTRRNLMQAVQVALDEK